MAAWPRADPAAAVLGHKRLGTTQGYTHLVPTDLKKELLATHPREIRKKSRKDSE